MGQSLGRVLGLTPGLGGAGADGEDSSGAGAAAGATYRYPPKSGGSYFASHFIMGGEKFDSPQPESFLFGENSDLNLLGFRPVAFPYPPPQANEPTKTLRSQVNWGGVGGVEAGGGGGGEGRGAWEGFRGREKPSI